MSKVIARDIKILNFPVDRVYRAFTDFASYPKWYPKPFKFDVLHLDSHAVGTTIAIENGRLVKWIAKITAFEPDKLIGIDYINGAWLGKTYWKFEDKEGKKITFDYMLANPPFGVDWKQVQQVIEQEHESQGYAGRFGPGLPRISDGSTLFLLHMISKMKPAKDGGSRLAIVFNGSPLFSGDAGSGESEIRRWIIENDWLEAIIALPLNMFYNTGIATYVWVLTNRKPAQRRGLVQLIDATQWSRPLRRNLGMKNCELAPEDIHRICDTFLAFKETAQSKIFPNAAFGYWKVTVERPLRLKGIDPERAYSPKEIKALRETAERDDAAPAVIRKVHKASKLAADPLHGLVEAMVAGSAKCSFTYPPDPRKPCSSAPHNPMRTVRSSFRFSVLRMRIPAHRFLRS